MTFAGGCHCGSIRYCLTGEPIHVGGGNNLTAELPNDLLLGNRPTSDVRSYTVYRSSKSSLNKTRFFAPQPQSIPATKIAFIAIGSTASASELVMNVVLPYLGANAALIGSNTFGKPVGCGRH